MNVHVFIFFSLLKMAERPEDLNLPNAVVTRIIKDAVSNIGHSKKK